MDAVRVLAPAKVNLFLGVGSRRSDGYHDVVTVIHAVDLCDELTIEPAEALSMTCVPNVGVPAERNLAWRAADAVAAAFGREPLVAITLEKHIPHGAGLGGGSSDAAAVIAGVATLWGEDPLDPRCLSVARSLGADVPFFLLGGAALMTGRGDVLERHLPAIDAPIVLVKPAPSVSTAKAYATFDARPIRAGSPDAAVAALKASDAAALAAALANNLGPVASGLVPEVAEAVAFLSAEDGVLGACVAGSGSAVFALCEEEAVAESICDVARTRGWWARATRLGATGVEVVDGQESR